MTPISVRFSRPDQAPPWEVLSGLRDALGAFLLVGAYARNVVCFGIAELPVPAPRTVDVDVAIAVPRGASGFDVRVSGLVGPRPSSRLTFSLPSLPGIPIDVIPYGPGVENVEAVPVDRDRLLDATGMREAASCAIRVRLVDGTRELDVAVPPLHAQIALKLIAYRLRVELPDLKDARDLAMLLQATWAGNVARDDCYDHGHLTPPELDFDHELVGPYLAGARILRDFGSDIARRARLAATDPRLPGHMRQRGDLLVIGVSDPRPSLRALVDGLADETLADDPDLGNPVVPG